VTERSIVHAWKACVPKGTGGSNPPPSAPLVERAREADCITVSHNKVADFNGVQRCVAKSSFRIAHSLPSRNLKVCARPGRTSRKKEPSFSLVRGWQPVPGMPPAGGHRATRQAWKDALKKIVSAVSRAKYLQSFPRSEDFWLQDGTILRRAVRIRFHAVSHVCQPLPGSLMSFGEGCIGRVPRP
jgi:hypothetical protein